MKPGVVMGWLLIVKLLLVFLIITLLGVKITVVIAFLVTAVVLINELSMLFIVSFFRNQMRRNRRTK